LYYGGFTVVEVDGVVAGALTGRLIPVPHHRGDAADLPDLFVPLLELEAVAAGTWYLEILAVYPEFRGRGLGSAFLGQAEGLARQAGASTMSIIVEDANHDAHRLYLREDLTDRSRGQTTKATGFCSGKR